MRKMAFLVDFGLTMAFWDDFGAKNGVFGLKNGVFFLIQNPEFTMKLYIFLSKNTQNSSNTHYYIKTPQKHPFYM
jgi:hypothetical protein